MFHNIEPLLTADLTHLMYMADMCGYEKPWEYEIRFCLALRLINVAFGTALIFHTLADSHFAPKQQTNIDSLAQFVMSAI